MKIKRISDDALVYSDTKGVTAAASTPDPDAPRPVYQDNNIKIYRNTDNLTGTKVVSAPADPLVAAARNGGKVTPTTVKREPYSINAFGANVNAGKRTGNMLGAAITGMLGNYAEAAGQVTQPQGLTIGESARVGLQGGTREQEMAAEQEKAARTDALKEKLYAKSDALKEQSSAYEAAAKEGLGKVGQFMVDVGVGGTQLVGDIALGAINPALGTAALATRAFGGAAQQARQAGATETQQQLYGAASAATSILVEKIAQVGKLFKGAYGGSVAGGSVDDILNKVIGKVVKNPTLQRILGSAIGEGGEEALEAIIQPALQAIYDKGESLNKTWFTDNGEEAKEYLAEVGYNALLGSTLGAVGAGGNANAPANAQNTPPNAAASRTEGEGYSNAPAPQNGTEASVGANMRYNEIEDSDSTGQESATKTAYQRAVDGGKSVQIPQDIVARYRAVNADPATKLKNVVKAFYESKLKGQKVDVDLNGGVLTVMFENDGKKKSVGWRMSPEKAASFERLLDLTKNAEYAYTSPNRDPNESTSIPRFHYYIADAVIGDAHIPVKIQIRDINTAKGTQETHYYYHNMQKNKGTDSPVADAKSTNIDGNAYGSFVDPNVTPPEQNVKRDVFVEDVVSRAAERNDSVGAARHGYDAYAAAEADYGILPQKDTAIRPDDVPVSIDGKSRNSEVVVNVKGSPLTPDWFVPVSTTGEDRVSETIGTVKGARITPEWFVPVLENRTMKGQFSYIPVANSETVQQAMDWISSRNDFDDAIKKWTWRVHHGRTDAETVAVGQLLYNNAVNSGDTRKALDILTDYQVLGRRAAQALQAMSIMQKLTPENRWYMVRRSIESMVDDLKLDKPITIDGALKDKYLNATNDAESDAALDEIAQSVADQLPTKGIDIWTTMRYTNMLGNFKTQVRNTVGNVAMYAMSGVKNAFATALERISPNTENTRSIRVEKVYRNVGKKDFDTVRGVVLQNGKYQEGSVGADDFKRKVEDAKRVNNTGNKYVDMFLTPLQKYSQATQWAMNNEKFGDAAFAKANYARALGGYLKAHGITPEQWNDAEWQRDNIDTVDKARTFAIEDAKENTFRDNNAISDFVSRMGRGKDTPEWAKVLSEGLLPFRKTPANILVRAEEYSPLGIFNTAVKAVQKAKGNENVSANDVADQLAKTLTGTALFVLGIIAANAGILRGGEDDDEEQAAFDDLRGHQPYSIEIGGKSFTLDWLTPASMPLFVGAEIANISAEEGWSLEAFLQACLQITNPMMEMSMMSGLSDALDNIKYSNNSGPQLALNIATSYLTQGLTNTLLGQLERTFEPNRMTTYTDKNKPFPDAQYKLGKALAKTPFLDYAQTEYIDAWGRTESNGNLAQRALNNFLNPAYTSTVSNDPLEAEIQRLYSATGENVLPERPEKYFTVDGERVDLTAEQYTEYATKRGNELYDLMQKVVESSAYKKASDSGKAEMLSNAKDYATKTAKAAVSDYTPDGWVAKAKNTGIAPEKYIAVLSQLDKVNEGSDSITQAEAQKALDATGLSRAEKAKMWNNINKQWKSNPYK